MTNVNLNGALFFIYESVVNDIGLNEKLILYACICTIHTIEEYKSQSRDNK